MIILALLSFKNEKLKLIYVYLSISYKDFTMQTVIKVSHLTDQVINFLEIIVWRHMAHRFRASD